MKLSLEKTRAFWLYIVFGVVALSLGVMLLPVWKDFEKLFFRNWGERAINVMMSAALIAYILFYLVKRIRRYSGTPAQIVAIVELVLMVVIAVVCTVSTFTSIITFGEPCRVFGLALWTRGTAGVFTGYYCDSSLVSERQRRIRGLKDKDEGRDKDDEEIDTDAEPKGRVDDFTVWRLVMSVLLISVGTYIVYDPPIGQIVFQWVFSCAVIFIGLFVAVYGASLKPVKVKVKEKKDEEEKTDVKAAEKKSAKATDKEKSADNEEKTKDSAKKVGEDKPPVPLLDEGKVTIKLTKSDDEKPTADEKQGEKTDDKTTEKTDEKATKKADEKTDEKADEKPQDKPQEPVALPPATTALTVVDTKKDKKKKNKKS